jgi:hypothetical protein
VALQTFGALRDVDADLRVLGPQFVSDRLYCQAGEALLFHLWYEFRDDGRGYWFVPSHRTARERVLSSIEKKSPQSACYVSSLH